MSHNCNARLYFQIKKHGNLRVLSGGIQILEKVDVRALRFGALLNTSSGSCDGAAVASLTDILGRAAVRTELLECVDGPGLNTALDRVTQSSIDVLVVLGGDGTIRTAAECCAPLEWF